MFIFGSIKEKHSKCETNSDLFFLLSANLDRIDAKSADVSHVREFHQSLVVGLIEACKGVAELYSPSHADNDLTGANFIQLTSIVINILVL